MNKLNLRPSPIPLAYTPRLHPSPTPLAYTPRLHPSPTPLAYTPRLRAGKVYNVLQALKAAFELVVIRRRA